jgi:hypothetical protein
MNNLDAEYITLCQVESDINQHLPTLKRYASLSDSVLELGVRLGVSTTALLAGRPKLMRSVDVVPPEHYGGSLQHLQDLAEEAGTDFEFVEASSTEIEIQGDVDMLFIDTLHFKNQLEQELKIHSPHINKFIAMHDTESSKEELIPVIQEFLNNNKNWVVLQFDTKNNGMTILYNKNNDEPATS